MKVDLEVVARAHYEDYRTRFSPDALSWDELTGRQREMCISGARAAYAAIAEQMREPTGVMWSAGRKVFQDEAEKYRQAISTTIADAHADRSPEKIWRAMWAAAEEGE